MSKMEGKTGTTSIPQKLRGTRSSGNNQVMNTAVLRCRIRSDLVFLGNLDRVPGKNPIRILYSQKDLYYSNFLII